MRKLLIVCLLLCVWAACAKAQEGPGFEVSGTYQYVRFNPGGGTSGINCQGGSGLFGAYLTSRVDMFPCERFRSNIFTLTSVAPRRTT